MWVLADVCGLFAKNVGPFSINVVPGWVLFAFNVGPKTRCLRFLRIMFAGRYSYPVRDEDVVRLSPLLYEHINMLGRYSFSVPDAVAKGELRPLRDSASAD